ncbi:MAG: hypothetical protein KAS72_10425 [Phycisphaerales bacterium]|nr:hypothetical protein [Phycisphaerales bacterium]
MKKCVLLVAFVGLCAAPAFARTTGPVAYEGPAVNGTRDWPGQVMWDQGYPDTYGAHSTIDYDTPMTSTTADDFLCTMSDQITDIHFWGWSYYGAAYLDGFRVTFWTDVPGDPGIDESHPGEILWQHDFFEADPGDPYGLGWTMMEDNAEWRINIPEPDWFYPEGTPDDPIVYWISIQGIMVDDGASDTFYWNFLDRYLDTWNDDAAFESEYFGFAPWANWGWPTPDGPDLYEGPFPDGWWKSADMAFVLTSIPAPSSLLLLGLGGLVVTRRR